MSVKKCKILWNSKYLQIQFGRENLAIGRNKLRKEDMDKDKPVDKSNIKKEKHMKEQLEKYIEFVKLKYENINQRKYEKRRKK